MSAHTPGPWVVRTERGEVWSECKGFSPCLVTQAAPKETRAERVANARLIAAAPDLLDVAEGLVGVGQVGVINDLEWFGRIVVAARAAIAKATQP